MQFDSREVCRITDAAAWFKRDLELNELLINMKISELTEEQMERINSYLHEASERYYYDLTSPDCHKVSDLYAYMMYVLKDGEIDENQVVMLVGSSLGHLFVIKKGFRWGELEDGYFIDVVVHHTETGETVYPFGVVIDWVVLDKKPVADICALYATFRGS